MTIRKMLIQHRLWLLNVVIPGFQRARPDDHESIHRCMLQVMDIDYLLETDPPRTPLNCQERKPYRDRQMTLPARRNKAPESAEGYKDTDDTETEGYSDD